MSSKYIFPLISSGAAFVLCITVAYAGSLSPSAIPAATGYTLHDLYTRLTTNAAATAGDHDFAPSGVPAGSLYTLTQLYDAIPTIAADRILSGTTLLGVGGTYDITNLATASVFNGIAFGSGSTGGLNLACNTSTFNGTVNLVATAYDGGGSGVNRWCMTNSGDAVASDILSDKIAWVDGLAVTGTMAAGYTYGDDSAAYVLGTATASGTALVNMWNGTRTSGGFPGGSQANGGVEDYNAGSAPAVDRYTSPAGWTACSVGNDYCGTSDSGADAQDNSTGLIWSMWCNGSACASFSDSSPLTYSWDNSAVNNGGRTASQLCSDHAGWSLPHQKQLLQAYIDGSYGNLETSGISRIHWSATTRSTSTTAGIYVNLSNGDVSAGGKTFATYVRCVRPAA